MKSRSILGLKVTKIAEKCKDVLTATKDIAHAVNEISGDPKLHNYVAVGAITLNKVAGYFNFDPTEDPTMREPLFIPYEMKDFLRKLAKNCPTEYHGDANRSYQVSQVGGQTILFQGTGWDVSMWIQVEDEEAHEEAEMRAIQSFGRITWETMGKCVEAVAPDKNGPREDMTYIKPWDMEEILRSDQTDQVLADVEAFRARGRKRALLLNGPPGTGKSCMIRAIASSIGGLTLFLDSTQLTNIDSRSLSFFLDYLAPDIVLIDDLDRVGDVSSLLSSIDRIRRETKLLMVTVNHLDKVDSAVKRAGRFDECVDVIRVRRPGDLIPGLEPKILKEVESWPIAFVEELKARIEVHGSARTPEFLEKLRKRVKSNS